MDESWRGGRRVNEVEKFLTSLGALAEALGSFRDNLMKNGFSRDEAVGLCAEMLSNLFNRNEN